MTTHIFTTVSNPLSPDAGGANICRHEEVGFALCEIFNDRHKYLALHFSLFASIPIVTFDSAPHSTSIYPRKSVQSHIVHSDGYGT